MNVLGAVPAGLAAEGIGLAGDDFSHISEIYSAAQFTASLGADAVVPIHFSSWEHFTETEDEIAASFAGAGLTDRLKWLTPGVPQVLEV